MRREEKDASLRREKDVGEGMEEKEVRKEFSRTEREGRRRQDELEDRGEKKKEEEENDRKENKKGETMEDKRRENIRNEDGGIILMKTRYSELLMLHQELLKTYGGENLPPFPPKKCLGNQKEDFLERRKKVLEVYFNRLALKIDFRKEKIINKFIQNHQESFNGSEMLLKFGSNQLKIDKEKTITIEDNTKKGQAFEKKDSEGKSIYKVFSFFKIL